jgi:hypothetical protein
VRIPACLTTPACTSLGQARGNRSPRHASSPVGDRACPRRRGPKQRCARARSYDCACLEGEEMRASPGRKDLVREMTDDLTADEIRALLKLEPNATCGFVRETYLSKLSIAPGGSPAPFADGRPLGSALYFMMSPAAPGEAAPHQEQPALSSLSRRPDRGADVACRWHAHARHVRTRPPRRSGPQLFIPGSTFHTARIIGARYGFSAPAPNGPAWCPPRTSNSAEDAAADDARDLHAGAVQQLQPAPDRFGVGHIDRGGVEGERRGPQAGDGSRSCPLRSRRF